MISVYANAQESINLDLLFIDWAISYNESEGNSLILRNAEDRKVLNEEDRKVPYSFRITDDSLICKNSFPRKKRIFMCLVGSTAKIDTTSNYGLQEIWFLNYENKSLTYKICSESSAENMICAYESSYRINKLINNYMELTLLNEKVGVE